MIYDRPIWALMKDAATELSPPYKTGEIVAWFAQHYPKIKGNWSGSFNRGVICRCWGGYGGDA